MSNDVTNTPPPRRNMPIIRQQSSLLPQDPAALKAMGAGIRSSFPVLSIDGKKWTAKFEGRSQFLKDHRGDPAEEFEAVILDVPDYLSKIYYDSPFGSNQGQPPRCYASNGIAPDKDVVNPISPTCAACPNNERGSRIYQGKALKICSDQKRLVVVPASDILNETWGGPMLLRVPPASLKPLRIYGEDLADGNALYYGCVTRMRFEKGIVHQKLLFEYVRPLTDDEVRDVLTLKSGKAIKRILATEPAASEPTLGGGVDEDLPEEIQSEDVQEEVVQPQVVQGFGKPPPSPHAPRRPESPAHGIPPAPATKAAPAPAKAPQQAPTPAARTVPQGAPAARAAPARPVESFRPTVMTSTTNKSEIGAAVNTPSEAPPSVRQVVTPVIPNSGEASESQEDMGISLPDELDTRFGALMKKA